MNVCVAAIDEPTFVGKSRKLKTAIAKRVAGVFREDGVYLSSAHIPELILTRCNAIVRR